MDDIVQKCLMLRLYRVIVSVSEILRFEEFRGHPTRYAQKGVSSGFHQNEKINQENAKMRSRHMSV